MSDGSSTLTQLPSEQTLYGCFLTVSVVALVNQLAFHTVLHRVTDGLRVRLRLVNKEEVNGRDGPTCVLFMFKLQHPEIGRAHV